MSDLLALADRVEKLTGPDRELDAETACAIFKTVKTDDDLIYRVPVRKCDDCAPGTYWHVSRSGRSLQTAPVYTTSLDVALTSVPEGWTRSVDASVLALAVDVVLYAPGITSILEVKGSSVSEPCATVAAALRARANGSVG